MADAVVHNRIVLPYKYLWPSCELESGDSCALWSMVTVSWTMSLSLSLSDLQDRPMAPWLRVECRTLEA
jgi:hypothetical protein